MNTKRNFELPETMAWTISGTCSVCGATTNDMESEGWVTNESHSVYICPECDEQSDTMAREMEESLTGGSATTPPQGVVMNTKRTAPSKRLPGSTT